MKKLLQQLHKRAIGDEKERLAERFLCRKGATVIQRNFSGPRGEIDLILKQGEYLVFVEIRYRQNRTFGGAAASVSMAKQKKIIATAQHFLQSQPEWQRSPCRFDVIAIDGNDINWITDAFQLGD